MTVMITLNQIRNNHPDGPPCKNWWTKLLSAQNKTKADDVQFPITDVLIHNGIEDANWCIDCLDGHDREKYHYMAEIAERVLHLFEGKYPDDMRPRLAIQAKRDYAEGKISKKYMNAAWAAAWAAAVDAERKDQEYLFRKWFG